MMYKILLIEDDMTMISLLRTLLQFEGYTVVNLKNDATLDTAIGTIQLEKPDLILCDVHLREVNGFDLLRAVQQDPSIANTRIIMSSGMDFSQRCQAAGAQEFILKPYLPDDLMKKVRKVLEQQKTTP